MFGDTMHARALIPNGFGDHPLISNEHPEACNSHDIKRLDVY